MTRELKNKFWIALDFDGTVIPHIFPDTPEDDCGIGSIQVLKELQATGRVAFVLNTMRSGKNREAAVEWFERNGIKLDADGFRPDQAEWTTSNKTYADLYIDDAALGVPLNIGYGYSRPFVDWKKVREYFINEMRMTL